jgi:TQXA domain-containing protein
LVQIYTPSGARRAATASVPEREELEASGHGELLSLTCPHSVQADRKNVMTIVHSHQTAPRADVAQMALRFRRIRRSSSEAFAPPAVSVRRRPSAPPDSDVIRLTRYRGGTYSHTVATIAFADGSSARTDLIRMHPNVAAYSLDAGGISPAHPSRYQVQPWAALPNLRAHAVEAEVDWILRNSFPSLGLTELSQRLRMSAALVGTANLAEHEAIAATQAAIWHFTNGLDLDTRPRDEPILRRHTPEGLVLEFDGAPELGGYRAKVVTDQAVRLELDKSTDGRMWRLVDGSAADVSPGTGSIAVTLGVGATLSSTRAGRPARGHRFYRLRVIGDAEVSAVGFRLQSRRRFSNPERIVHLYEHLVAGARNARRAARPTRVVADRATVGGAVVATEGLVGPLRLESPTRTQVSAASAQIVDMLGQVLPDHLAPQTQFYVRPSPGASSTTIQLTVPPDRQGVGRVATGLTQDSAAQRFTPLALAVATPAVHEFDVTWPSSSVSRSPAEPLGRTDAHRAEPTLRPSRTA